MARERKRICLALSNVGAEDAIEKIVKSKFNYEYEIAENVRSREALISAINREKFNCLILREDLTGNIDLIDLLKAIRTDNEDMQIIFLMNNRENGDPFYIELFLFHIYDFVVLPDIKLDDIFGFLQTPRHFKDVIRFLPIRAERIRNLIVEANTDMKVPPKLNEEGDIDEIFTVNIQKPKQPDDSDEDIYYKPQRPVYNNKPDSTSSINEPKEENTSTNVINNIEQSSSYNNTTYEVEAGNNNADLDDA